MFNKRKVLYSAMAVALMSGGGSAWATGLTFANGTISGGTKEVASEAVAVGELVGTGSQFAVAYIPENDIAVDFDIFFTLSGGATWNDSPANTLLSETLSPGLSIIGPNRNPDNTEVRYRIGAGGTNITATTDRFTFSFSVVDKMGVLGTEGGSISLSTRLQLTTGDKSPDASADNNELKIVTSTDAQSVKMVAETPAAKIDVGSDSLTFLVGNSNVSTATLGAITIDNVTPLYLSSDLSADFDPNDSADLTPVSGEIVIVDGPFNASLAAPGRVFIDINNTGVFEEDEDLLATSVSSTEASWTLSGGDVGTLVDQNSAIPSSCESIDGCNVVVESDGVTAIEEASTQPTAIITIQYSGNITKKVTKKLAYIKRNGSVCTLYNIPNTTATDELNIRVTNTSSKDGTVKAKMYDLNGNVLIKDQTLIETIKPKQTVRITAEELLALAGGTTWPGRAVLTLSSTIPDGYMEVFGLLRNRLGGPLLNLSAGAQGNGCGK